MFSLTDRKKADLLIQFQALDTELRHWIQISAPGQPFERHQLQIRAAAECILLLNQQVKSLWNQQGGFAQIQQARIRCGNVQTVWNFFRQKLLLRADARLATFLTAADYCAWECYGPLFWEMQVRKFPVRPQPLVTFHDDPSPFALKLQSEYEPLNGMRVANQHEVFRKALSALPIPIIGIPWQSADSLTELALVPHEVGHLVVAEFNLSEPIQNALNNALNGSSRRVGWSEKWFSEIFADLFACYAGGPATVWALTSAIPEAPEKEATRIRPSGEDWGIYPPATLRILLNCHALKILGFSKDAEAIEKYWKATYTTHAMEAFVGDLDLVIQTVYDAAALPPELAYRKQLSHETDLHLRLTSEMELPTGEDYVARSAVSVAERISREKPLANHKQIGSMLVDRLVNSRAPANLGHHDQTQTVQFPKPSEAFTSDLLGL